MRSILLFLGAIVGVLLFWRVLVPFAGQLILEAHALFAVLLALGIAFGLYVLISKAFT